MVTFCLAFEDKYDVVLLATLQRHEETDEAEGCVQTYMYIWCEEGPGVKEERVEKRIPYVILPRSQLFVPPTQIYCVN